MNDLEIRLEAEYESALDTEAPPSGVDVELARVQGRALRRRRRTAMTGSGLLVATLATLIAVGLLPGVGFGHGSADTASGADYSGESSPPADDPLATRVSFGWLPDGVSVVGMTTQYPDIGDLTAGGAGMRFTASVLPRDPQLATFCPTAGLTWSANPKASDLLSPVPCDPPAPKVNDRTAYWVNAPGGPGVNFAGVALRWQYADDAWAQLNAAMPANTDSATVTEVMYRIAENIHVSRFRAAPLPFQVKMPAGWHFAFADWLDGAQGRQVGAVGGERGASVAIGTGGTGTGTSEVLLWENPASDAFPTAGEQKTVTGLATPAQTQNLTVDGHQAKLLTGAPDQKTLIVHDVNGLDIAVGLSGSTALELINSAGGIVDYYHTITTLGADQANWTTHVFE